MKCFTFTCKVEQSSTNFHGLRIEVYSYCGLVKSGLFVTGVTVPLVPIELLTNFSEATSPNIYIKFANTNKYKHFISIFRLFCLKCFQQCNYFEFAAWQWMLLCPHFSFLSLFNFDEKIRTLHKCRYKVTFHLSLYLLLVTFSNTCTGILTFLLKKCTSPRIIQDNFLCCYVWEQGKE